MQLLGDAVLIVNGSNVSLLDLEGKEIGKSSGYKLQELAELKDGETLSVGSKEIEVIELKIYDDILIDLMTLSNKANPCQKETNKIC